MTELLVAVGTALALAVAQYVRERRERRARLAGEVRTRRDDLSDI